MVKYFTKKSTGPGKNPGNVSQLQAYSTSDNEAPPISRVLIGRHLIFC